MDQLSGSSGSGEYVSFKTAYRVESALADTPSHTAVLNQC